MGFFDIFRSPIRKVATLIDNFLSSTEDDLSQLDPEILKKAYRENFFIKAIVNISASFLFSELPSIEAEDEEAQEILNEIWADNHELLISTARDSSLCGNSYIFVGYNNGIDLISLFPSKVSIKPNPLDLRNYEKVIITHRLPLELGGEEIRQELTKDCIRLFRNGKLTEIRPNRIKEIPIVHIAYERFNGELYGTGDINEALYKVIKAYEDIIEAARKNIKYHGTPIPVIETEDTQSLEKQIKEGKWTSQKALVLPSGSKAYFLESQRPFGELKDFLQTLFYNIVVLSETPEFLFGSHTPSSWASVKEQLHPIIRKTKRRQLIWKEALQKANRLILKTLEAYEGKKFSSYKTTVQFPEPSKKDLEAVVRSVAQLVGSGIISPEEGREVVKDLLPEIVQAEQSDYNPDKNWNESEK
ncbi:phage portal protein [Desulfurobacterium crinifex]